MYSSTKGEYKNMKNRKQIDMVRAMTRKIQAYFNLKAGEKYFA